MTLGRGGEGPLGPWRHVSGRFSPAQRSLIIAGVLLVASLVVFRLVSPSLVNYRNTKAGDCLLDSPSVVSANVAGEVRTVSGAPVAQIVGCDRDHVQEVMGLPLIAAAAGTPYPVDGVPVEAARACTDLFATYVGRPLAGSSLAVTAYYPERAEWEDRNVRTVVCVVVDPTSPIHAASLKGAAR